MALLLTWSVCLCGSVAFGRDYCVATDGDDANPGTIERPFATLEKARDTVRQSKSEGATVILRGGKYFRTQSFPLTDRDSGRPDKPIIYRAYPGETVRIIGGCQLAATDFVPVSSSDPVWSRLDPSARGRCVRSDAVRRYEQQAPLRLELSVDGKLMPLARWPNEGFVRTTSAANDITFGYDDPRPERWLDAPDAHAVGYWCHGWSNQIVKIAKIDTANKTITADKTPPYGIRAKKPYYVVNLVERSIAGRMVLRPRGGNLYLWPPDDFDKGDILISTLDAPIIALKNASHVRLEELTIEMGAGDGIEVSGAPTL
jgi:hypothetical protein